MDYLNIADQLPDPKLIRLINIKGGKRGWVRCVAKQYSESVKQV